MFVIYVKQKMTISLNFPNSFFSQNVRQFEVIENLILMLSFVFDKYSKEKHEIPLKILCFYNRCLTLKLPRYYPIFYILYNFFTYSFYVNATPLEYYTFIHIITKGKHKTLMRHPLKYLYILTFFFFIEN